MRWLPSSSSWKLSRLARGTSLFSRGLLRGFSPLPGSAPTGKHTPASAPEPGVSAEGGSGPGPRSDSPPGALSPLPEPGSSPVSGGGSNGGGSCSSSRSRSSSSESFRLRTFTLRAFRNIPAARKSVSLAPTRRPRQRTRLARVPAGTRVPCRYGAPRVRMRTHYHHLARRASRENASYLHCLLSAWRTTGWNSGTLIQSPHGSQRGS